MKLLLLIISLSIYTPSLHQLIDTPEYRAPFIQDALQVIDAEIEAKKGFFGFTIRNTYKLVSRLDNGEVVEKSISNMLGEFLTAMEPFHQSYAVMEPDERIDFSDYLDSYNTQVTAALLAIADRRRDLVTNGIISGTYDRFRPYASKHVSEAVPAIGRLIAKYAY